MTIDHVALHCPSVSLWYIGRLSRGCDEKGQVPFFCRPVQLRAKSLQRQWAKQKQKKKLRLTRKKKGTGRVIALLKCIESAMISDVSVPIHLEKVQD